MSQKIFNMVNKGMNKKLNIINNTTDVDHDKNSSIDDNDNNTENDNEEGSPMNCDNENSGELESEGSSSVRTITPTSTSELIEERISHTKK